MYVFVYAFLMSSSSIQFNWISISYFVSRFVCMYVYIESIIINIFLLIIHSHSINIQSYRSFFSSLSLSLSIYICLWMVFFFIHPLYIVDRGFTAHCFIFQSIYVCVRVCFQCVCVYSSEWIKTTVKKKKKGKTYVIKKRKEKKFVFSNLDPDFLFVWLYQKFVPSLNQIQILLFWRKNWWIRTTLINQGKPRFDVCVCVYCFFKKLI